MPDYDIDYPEDVNPNDPRLQKPVRRFRDLHCLPTFAGGKTIHKTHKGKFDCCVCMDSRSGAQSYFCRVCDNTVCAGCYSKLTQKSSRQHARDLSGFCVEDDCFVESNDDYYKPDCPCCKSPSPFSIKGIDASKLKRSSINHSYYIGAITIDKELKDDASKKRMETLCKIDEELSTSQATLAKVVNAEKVIDSSPLIIKLQEEYERNRNDIINLQDTNHEIAQKVLSESALILTDCDFDLENNELPPFGSYHMKQEFKFDLRYTSERFKLLASGIESPDTGGQVSIMKSAEEMSKAERDELIKQLQAM